MLLLIVFGVEDDPEVATVVVAVVVMVLVLVLLVLDDGNKDVEETGLSPTPIQTARLAPPVRPAKMPVLQVLPIHGFHNSSSAMVILTGVAMSSHVV